jgi:flavin-binding protein dodecin
MGDTLKTIELVGNSTNSWEEAAENALADADETIDDIQGIEIVSQTAHVEGGQIDRYKATIHVAFQLQDR